MRVDELSSITAGDMSGDITGSRISLEHIGMFSVQVVMTGAPVGNLYIQSSNDGTTWDNITGATYAVSAAGSVTFNIVDCAYKYARVFYDRTGGTGSLTDKVYIKGF